VVEDNEVNRDVVSQMLIELGFSCQCAASGQEALATLKTQPFNLVLMDCQMPDLDGYETTRLFRVWEREKAGETRRLPIVALTAHAIQGDREHCLDAGMDDCLTKPLELDSLINVREKWLGHRPSLAALKTDRMEPPVAPSRTVHGINFAALLRRCMGKPELVDRLTDKFLRQTRRDLPELETAVRSSDLLDVPILVAELRKLIEALPTQRAIAPA
jgi:CheY-like chemotaxis protein